jgi:hypothetical protein
MVVCVGGGGERGGGHCRWGVYWVRGVLEVCGCALVLEGVRPAMQRGVDYGMCAWAEGCACMCV